MKILLSAILAAVVLCGISLAQDSTPSSSNGAAPQAQQNPAPAQSASPSSAQASNSLRIAPGSVIPVQLTKSIDAKKVKTGDEVEAKVTQDLKAGNGDIVVPKDTKVVGRVTEAQARNKEQKESQVGIAFDRAVMKTGGDVTLPMSIQAIIAPSYLSGGSNNSGGQPAGQPSPAGNAGTMPQGNNGRSGTGMGTQQPYPTASAPPSGDQSANAPHQQITGNTQGVLGIPNLTLSTSAGTAQGSVVTSEKDNVKLDSGTLMLLRVNQ